MSERLTLLIIGAGPFGLSCRRGWTRGIDHLVVGEPMGFWKTNMPQGMYLRSDVSWHLDPTDNHTIERYLKTLDRTPADVEPLSRDFYLNYCAWFQEQKQIKPERVRVIALNRRKKTDHRGSLRRSMVASRFWLTTPRWRWASSTSAMYPGRLRTSYPRIGFRIPAITLSLRISSVSAV